MKLLCKSLLIAALAIVPTQPDALPPDWVILELCGKAALIGQSFVYWKGEQIECISIEGKAPPDPPDALDCPIGCFPRGYPFPGCDCPNDVANEPDFDVPGADPTPQDPCKLCESKFASCTTRENAFSTDCNKFIEGLAFQQCRVNKTAIDGRRPRKTEKCKGCVEWACEFEDSLGKKPLCPVDGGSGFFESWRACGFLSEAAPLEVCTDTTHWTCMEGWLGGLPQVSISQDWTFEFDVGKFSGGASQKVTLTFSSREGLRLMCSKLLIKEGFSCFEERKACFERHSCTPGQLPKAKLPWTGAELKAARAGPEIALIEEPKHSPRKLDYELQVTALKRWKEFENRVGLSSETKQILRRAAFAAQHRVASVLAWSYREEDRERSRSGEILDLSRNLQSLRLLRGFPRKPRSHVPHNEFLLIDGTLFSIAAAVLPSEEYQEFRRLFPTWALPFGRVEIFVEGHSGTK